MPVNQLPDEVRKERAKELLNQGRLEDAHKVLSELCVKDQQDIEIWSLYSAASGYLGLFDEVIAACEKILQIEPDYLPALNSLASALSELGLYDDAFAKFEVLLRLAPENPAVLNNYGHALYLAGRLAEARGALGNAVRIQPHYAEAHYNLAVLLEQEDQLADALQAYEQAASLKPGLPGINDHIDRLREIVTNDS